MASKSVTLHPGETVILPAGTVITSMITDGSIEVTSTCGNLPTPTSYKCGYFYIIVDNDANSGSPMDESNTSYKGVTVGDVTFTMDTLVVTGTNPGTATPVATLNLYITDQALFKFMGVAQTNDSKKTRIYLYFRVPEDLFSSVYLNVMGQGSTMYFPPNETECGSYPAP